MKIYKWMIKFGKSYEKKYNNNSNIVWFSSENI